MTRRWLALDYWAVWIQRLYLWASERARTPRCQSYCSQSPQGYAIVLVRRAGLMAPMTTIEPSLCVRASDQSKARQVPLMVLNTRSTDLLALPLSFPVSCLPLPHPKLITRTSPQRDPKEGKLGRYFAYFKVLYIARSSESSKHISRALRFHPLS